MYSKASWGGKVEPYISVKFMQQEASQSIASLIIYEFKDYPLIGRPDPNNPGMVRLSGDLIKPLLT